jgi:hypothetical protein
LLKVAGYAPEYGEEPLVSTYWRMVFEKDAVDDRRVFQKAEVLLDADLAFIKGKQFLG